MTLWIRADASAETGIGHVMRTMAIAEEAVRKGWHIRYVCRADPAVTAIFSGTQFALEVVTDEAWVEKTHPGDAAVLDGYELPGQLERELHNRGVRVGRVEDRGIGSFDVDVLLDQNDVDGAGYELPARATLLLGPRHALIRSSIRRRRTETGLRGDHLLLTFGGTDPLDLASSVIDLLVGHRLFATAELLLSAVGPYPDRALPEWLTVTRDPTDVGAVLAGASAAISAAGSTTWELLYLGIPTGLVQVAPNQRRVLGTIAAEDAAEIIGTADELAERLAAVMLRLADPGRGAELRANARQLVDGGGAVRFVDALLSGERS